MNLANMGDRVIIDIVSVDPDGIPCAIEFRYFRGDLQIYPGLCDDSWAKLRGGALEFISSWWKERFNERAESV